MSSHKRARDIRLQRRILKNIMAWLLIRSKTPTPEKRTSNSALVGQTLESLAEQTPYLAAITAAMPSGTGLETFGKRFPDRFFDVGIAEEHATTMAAGLARGGVHPFFVVYSTFLQKRL